MCIYFINLITTKRNYLNSKTFHKFMSDLKQVILMRTDLKMSKGKMIAQGAHASVDATLSANKKLVSKWRSIGMKKIALKVESLEQLKNLLKQAQEVDLITSQITDAGHTEVVPGTITCGVIGPGPEIQIDKITGELKIL
jgi:PTH2 family peptidyl-tRNA hydrolase